MSQNKFSKNPSRETCESIIRRILTAEIGERGSNEHFRQAADFMPYFESLYPASDSLSKQVQRAIKSLGLPKDERGYFVINKSPLQLKQDQELKRIFGLAASASFDLSDCEALFLEIQDTYADYLMHLMTESESLKGTYVTMQKTCNGIILYTRNKEQALKILRQLGCSESQ
ncbi:MAG: hypothetical protein HFH36_04630 [Lachnospiraceae bacterium]|nr:hypothetical protein [Lachnospiraceae bacterium]